MFLTEVSFRNNQLPNFLTKNDAHAKHIFVNSFFPDNHPESVKNILWAFIDSSVFLILSAEMPNINNIKNDNLKLMINLKTTSKIDSYYETILSRGTISYSITVNPVVTKNKKRFALRKNEVPMWWENKLKTIGLSNNFFTITSYATEIVSKERAFSIVKASIKGTAAVEDPGVLKEVLYHGVGREKAYGCGLLLARI